MKFKRLRHMRIVSLSMVLLLGILISGCKKKKLPLEDSIEMELERAVDNRFDGVILCVNKSGERTLYSAGWKNKEAMIPADPYSLFKIASISKLYIATACAKLLDNGSLSLDKTLAEYLPDLKDRIEYANDITLKMLIKHRSGIPDFFDHPDYPWSEPYDTRAETLELILDEPADFSPDKKYRYSNTNYLLIGEILDKTLGYSHHLYIKNEILIPLGLNNTYSLLSEVNLDDVMSGYYKGGEDDMKQHDFISPGGSMVATAEDVSIFVMALNDGSLLSETEQEIYSDLYRYEHTGLLPGYQSIAEYHPGIDASVILFMNTSGGTLWFQGEKLYKRIIKILEKKG